MKVGWFFAQIKTNLSQPLQRRGIPSPLEKVSAGRMRSKKPIHKDRLSNRLSPIVYHLFRQVFAGVIDVFHQLRYFSLRYCRERQANNIAQYNYARAVFLQQMFAYLFCYQSF